MFNRTPIGKLHVMVCGTTPCMLCGARGIYQALKQHLGIDYGQTTRVSKALTGNAHTSLVWYAPRRRLQPWHHCLAFQ